MNRIETRLKKLEKQAGIVGHDPLSIFIRIFSLGSSPVESYRLLGDKTNLVTRQSGETDESLEQRAVEASKALMPQKTMFVFIPTFGSMDSQAG